MAKVAKMACNLIFVVCKIKIKNDSAYQRSLICYLRHFIAHIN
jgi:hypothetical protein